MATTPTIGGMAPRDPNGNPIKANPWATSLDAGLSGLGDYLKGAGSANAAGQQEANGLSGQLANVYGQQANRQQQGATSVLGANKPGEDVNAYGQLALKRALLNGYQMPTEMSKFSPISAEGLQGVKDTANQYYSDPAIAVSMATQQKRNTEVDPYGPIDNVGAIVSGNGPGSEQYNDLLAYQKDAQSRQGETNDLQKNALIQALRDTQNHSKSSLLGSLLGIGGSIAKAFV